MRAFTRPRNRKGLRLNRPTYFIPQPRSSPEGFTLVELLVVVAIISILAGLLMPGLAAAREMGRRASCMSKLRQFGAAALMYANDNNGSYPPPYSGNYPNSFWYDKGLAVLFLGNYLPGYSTIFNGTPTYSDNSYKNPLLVCPSETRVLGWSSSSYVFYPGLSGGGYPNSPTRVDEYPDWLLIGDVAGSCYNHTASRPAGANWAYVDGHVQWHNVATLTVSLSPFGVIYLFPQTPNH